MVTTTEPIMGGGGAPWAPPRDIHAAQDLKNDWICVLVTLLPKTGARLANAASAEKTNNPLWATQRRSAENQTRESVSYNHVMVGAGAFPLLMATQPSQGGASVETSAL